jgi:group I intron endonuclease
MTDIVIGIYCIKNKINDKVYIGSSHNVERRLKAHWYKLRTQKHNNSRLQLDFEQFGELEFVFSTLEVVLLAKEKPLPMVKTLMVREQYYDFR